MGNALQINIIKQLFCIVTLSQSTGSNEIFIKKETDKGGRGQSLGDMSLKRTSTFLTPSLMKEERDVLFAGERRQNSPWASR